MLEHIVDASSIELAHIRVRALRPMEPIVDDSAANENARQVVFIVENIVPSEDHVFSLPATMRRLPNAVLGVPTPGATVDNAIFNGDKSGRSWILNEYLAASDGALPEHNSIMTQIYVSCNIEPLDNLIVRRSAEAACRRQSSGQADNIIGGGRAARQGRPSPRQQIPVQCRSIDGARKIGKVVVTSAGRSIAYSNGRACRRTVAVRYGDGDGCVGHIRTRTSMHLDRTAGQEPQ